MPVTPAERFSPAPEADRALIGLWLPAALEPASGQVSTSSAPVTSSRVDTAVELEKVVPASGNMSLCGQQFLLGPARAGQLVRFWVSVDLIHLFIGGTRVKTVRSHLSVTDLAQLVVAQGAVNARPSPLPPIEPGDAVEVERVVSKDGLVSLGGNVILAAEVLGGRRVGIRIETDTIMFYDLDSRELLRVRPNPLSHDKIIRLRGNRPAGPTPRPSAEPIRVQRRASTTGVIMVCGQNVALGRIHQHQTVTVHVSDTTLAIELDDGETGVVRRTTTLPVRNIKADRPRPDTSVI
jgi:hypothetical protein